jgi:hypothetical protein
MHVVRGQIHAFGGSRRVGASIRPRAAYSTSEGLDTLAGARYSTDEGSARRGLDTAAGGLLDRRLRGKAPPERGLSWGETRSTEELDQLYVPGV